MLKCDAFLLTEINISISPIVSFREGRARDHSPPGQSFILITEFTDQ